MTNIKIIIVFVIFLGILVTCQTTGFAQNVERERQINGTVFDNAHLPVSFATVSLLASKDSSLIKSVLSDSDGKYLFKSLSNGSYLIKVSFIGFKESLSPVIYLTDKSSHEASENLILTKNSQQLQAVTVSASRPLFSYEAGKTIVNVSNNPLASGRSALDILKLAPGVSVDQNGNISLNGKNGVSMMIDDKLTYLSGAQLASLLKSTNGNSISSIEIIAVPSAQYDAAGNAGVINIHLKKNKKEGFNGNFLLTAGYGLHASENTSLILNYQKDKFNTFGSFSHDDNLQRFVLQTRRQVDSAGTTTFFKQGSTDDDLQHNNDFKAGTDYAFTANHTLGISFDFKDDPSTDQSVNQTLLGRNQGITDNYLNTTGQSRQGFDNIAINLNDRLQMDTLGQHLNTDIDYLHYRIPAETDYQTTGYSGTGLQIGSASYLKNLTPSVIDVRSAKTDYTLPFHHLFKLETGAKASYVSTDNELTALQKTGGVYTLDTTRSNHFIYKETITAAYANLSNKYEKTSVAAGLRVEYTHSNGNLISTNQQVNSRYLQLFPSINVSQQVASNNTFTFAYSRRIDRPDYQDLNPFVLYIDQYTYRKGNPFLKPQYSNIFEVDYSYKKTINLSFNYSSVKDFITREILTDTIRKATYQTDINLDQEKSYTIIINTPYTIFKWWTGDLDINGFYNHFKTNALLGGNLNSGKAGYIIKTNQNFTLPLNFKSDLAAQYYSSSLNGIDKMAAYEEIDASLSRSFATNKISLKLSGSDLLNTDAFNITSNYRSNNYFIHAKPESRVIRLTFTYVFGGSEKIKMTMNPEQRMKRTG